MRRGEEEESATVAGGADDHECTAAILLDKPCDGNLRVVRLYHDQRLALYGAVDTLRAAGVIDADMRDELRERVRARGGDTW